LHMAQLMPLPLTVSCFTEIQIGFTFLVPAHLGSPGKRAVKWACVCSIYYYWHCPHSMRSIKRYSVRPSVRLSVRPSLLPPVCPSVGPQQQSRCCWFAAVSPGQDISIKLLQQRRTSGECGQCHVVSIRR